MEGRGFNGCRCRECGMEVPFLRRRRPRRRDGACLLQMHLLKCFGVALVALLPSSITRDRRADAVQGRCVLEYGPIKWILKGAGARLRDLREVGHRRSSSGGRVPAGGS